MSQINFAHFRDAAPELSSTWDKLEQWVRRHPGEQFLECRRLARELYPLATSDLAEALMRLYREGAVTSTLRVIDPGGSILEGDFSTRDEIPLEMQDRMRDYFFNVEDNNVLPIFWLAKK